MRVVLLGPQGCGKGTQAERLAALSGATHIATGDLVRAEIAAGTELGHTFQGYNDRGDLVPDALIVALVIPHLMASASWILDGFPRDERQAVALDDELSHEGVTIDRVVALEVADADLIDRLLGRRLSLATGKTYHITFDPPPADDPGPFVRRTDDVPEDIQHRLDLYHRKTEPLRDYYARRGLLTMVDATGSMEAVTAMIAHALTEAGITLPLPA